MKRLAGKPALEVVEAAVDGLLAVLAEVPDPRSRFGRRYPLAVVLALAVCAVTCDANGFTAIAQWAADLDEEHLTRFGLAPGRYSGRIRVPSEKTFRAVLATVDPAALLDAVGRYGCHRLERAGMPQVPEHAAKEREARRREKAGATRHDQARRVLAADGKTLRGSGRTRHQRTHLVALVDQDTRRVDGRISVDGKTNETPALRAYVRTVELDEAVLTADAAHTCRATAQAIIDAGGHYLLIVKGNQPTLFGALAEILLTGPDAARTGAVHAWSERGHGRITRRVLRAAAADGIDFPGAAQVMMTMRHRRPINAAIRESRQIVYAITSLTAAQAGPAELAEIEQRHWGCEARHHILDVTFGEDHCQARAGNAPANLSTLRDLAIDAFRATGHVNIAHARRHYTHRAERVLDLYEL
jgi:predicted transposase YbfD/YdcC